MRRSRRARRAASAALGILLAAATSVGAAEKRIVTDAAGRRVEVPTRIERVYAAGGPASLLVYALAPEKLLGWVRPLTPDERAYLPPRFAELPTLGRLTGRGNTASVEVVLAARPDIILDYGSLAPTYVSLADRVQQQTGIPYVLFDGSLTAIPAALASVGDLLGVRERAAELARYAERVLTETDRLAANVPPPSRPRVYYARGPQGLETASKGSINVESLERLGAQNVADTRSGGGLTAVLAQVGALARRGIAVILSTHDPDQAFLCADRVALLHQGRLVRTGQPEVVITRDSLRAIYDVDVDIVQVHREGYETRACIPALAPRAGLTGVANMTAVRSGSSGDATAF